MSSTEEKTSTTASCVSTITIKRPTAPCTTVVTLPKTWQSQTQSCSTDTYPPIAVQSASSIALPSLVTTLPPVGASSTPQPAPSSVLQASITSDLYSGLTLSPLIPTTYPASAGSNSTAVHTGTLVHLVIDLGHVVSAVEFAYTAVRAGVKGLNATMASVPPPAPTPLTALSVLLSALPSEVASNIEEGYSSITHQLLATSVNRVQRPTGSPSANLPITKQTAPAQPANTSISSSQTFSPTTLQTTTISIPTTASTTSSAPSTAATAAAAHSSTPSPSAAQQQSPGTIAGIATGACAGVVLVVLALFWFQRRRQQQGKIPRRGGGGSKRESQRIYPEVAWLYDVRMTPPSSPHARRDAAGEALLQGRASNEREGPQAASDAAEMREFAQQRAQGARSAEPLLAPIPAATRDNSPAGSDRSRSRSPAPGSALASHPIVPARDRAARIDTEIDERPLAGMWDVPPGWAR